MNGETRPIGSGLPPEGEPAPLPENLPPSEPTPTPGVSENLRSPVTPPSPQPPTGEAGPPPPPPPQVDVRTMASDSKSLEASGGLGTTPKTFSPSDLGGPREEVRPLVTPKRKSSSGRLISIIVLIALLGIAGGAGYFFILPRFFPREKQVEPPLLTPPAVTEVPVPVAPLVHQSFFAGPPTVSGEVNLTEIGLDQIATALQVPPGELLPAAGSIKEVSFKINDELLSAEEFLRLLLPETRVESFFEPDFTAFLYYTDKAAWPGYIFRLKSDVDPQAVEETVAKIEQSATLTSLYLENPGSPSKAGFKNGAIGSVKTRYLPYSTLGASLNYGWVNSYLIVSTSFEGFKKALDLLRP